MVQGRTKFWPVFMSSASIQLRLGDTSKHSSIHSVKALHGAGSHQRPAPAWSCRGHHLCPTFLKQGYTQHCMLVEDMMWHCSACSRVLEHLCPMILSIPSTHEWLVLITPIASPTLALSL